MTITAINGAFGEVLDVVDGGRFKVTGNTERISTPAGSANVPVSRRVRLHDQLTGKLVRETWSYAGTGNYVFDRIRAGVFYVVAFDHTGAYNGVIATGVASEPM